MRRKLVLFASILLGFGALGLIFYFIGWQRILTEVLSLGWIGFGVLFADVSLTFLFWILTWWVILRSWGMKPSWVGLLQAMMSGYAITYLTPSLYFGGEPLRVYIVAKELKASLTKVIATVVVAKFLEGISLVCFVLLGTFHALLTQKISPPQQLSLFIGNVVLGGLVLLGLINFSLKRFWASSLIRKLRFSPIKKIAEKVYEVEKGIYNLFKYASPTSIALALTFSIAATFLIYLRPQIFFYFSQDIIFSPGQLSLVFVLNVFLGIFFWVTPGGIGISEGGRIGIFKLVGIGEAGAVAFSFALKIIEIFFVGVGVVYMLHLGLRRIVKDRK